MTRTKTEFNEACAAFEQMLPDSYTSDGDIEDYHRRFVNEDASRTISLLWLTNSSNEWFEIDGYEDGEITGSTTVNCETVRQETGYEFTESLLDEVF